MIDSEKDTILIERFLNLELSDKELIAFEERLSKDFVFDEKLHSYIAAQNMVNDSFPSHKENSRKQQWKAILEKDKKDVLTLKSTSWRWITGIAASLVLLFLIWQLNSPVPQPNMEVLLNNAWNKKIGLDYKSLRSIAKDSIKIKIYRSFEAYQKENYEFAIDMLSNLNNTNTTDYFEDILLLRALSYYKKDNINIALKTLDTLANYPTQKKANVALWYQGLIYLEQGNTLAAKQYLILPDKNIQEIQFKENEIDTAYFQK